MAKRKDETSYRETAFGIIPRSKLIPLEIEGVKRTWDFILEKRKKTKIAIMPSFVKKLHKIGFAWIFPKEGGNFRKVEVTVSDHTPPKYYLISQLMDNYCKDLAERLKHLPDLNQADFLGELIRFLAWAHHRFLWIHPFKDYNGRIGRLLISIILLNLNLPPIELKVETKTGRKKYIQALKNADEGNLSELEKLIRDAVEETTKELRVYEKK
ncbi:Fic family protein [Candidatus Parcubacteria bacterium]|nr:Fic family protein [Patescibacteria group bacterium]MBU4380804.1 Fic family protein [Patescibacteria group bacterium]MCG2689108.1 Fic family protein [Candidatus Parcubacteria bacterium]